MKRRYILYLMSLVALSVYFFFEKGDREDIYSVMDHQDKIEEFISELKNQTFNEQKYLNSISKSKSAKEHEKMGRKFYSLAYGKNLYAKNRLSLLKMAKSHLILARKLGADHE